MIIVMVKHSQGNDTVGDIRTIVEFYPDDTPIKTVYNEMKERGNWDIVIPRIQPETKDSSHAE